MPVTHRDHAKAAIYTGFQLARLIQGAVPAQISEEIRDLIVDNLNCMGVALEPGELRQLEEAPKEKALGIARNIKSKLLAAITAACGSQIGNWFELVFTISLLETTPDVLPQFAPQLQELATHAGYPKSAFSEILEGLGTPGRRNFLQKFIEKSLEIAALPCIFISHETSEHKVAEEFSKLLEGKNVKSFVASIDILPGTDWYDKLRTELYNADELLLIMSPKSMKSPWVMIEIGAAWALGKPITPAIIQGDPEDAPEPIKKFQAKMVTTSAAKQELIETIASRIHSAH